MSHTVANDCKGRRGDRKIGESQNYEIALVMR